MRARAIMLVAAAALALVGCGDHNLVVRIDVLSYLDPAYRVAAFGPVPAAPGGLATGELALVDDQAVNLLEGLDGVAEVRSVSIGLSAIVRDSTGSGTDTLRVYASDETTAPRTTAPILTEVVTLVPGRTDTVEVTVPADARVADLFVRRKMRLGVTTSLRGPVSGDPLNGRLTLRTLDAIVIAGRKAF
jgi:hypothetical protein